MFFGISKGSDKVSLKAGDSFSTGESTAADSDNDTVFSETASVVDSIKESDDVVNDESDEDPNVKSEIEEPSPFITLSLITSSDECSSVKGVFIISDVSDSSLVFLTLDKLSAATDSETTSDSDEANSDASLDKER